MSNITNYLNKVKTAIYGKEVRGAIHDAIKQVYDDASVEHDNANMEVKLARGTHNTLNDRLDNVDEIQAQTNAQLSDVEENMSKMQNKYYFESVVFKRLTDFNKANYFRIPFMAVTKNDTIIVGSDVRYQSPPSDQSFIELGLARSVDGGRTWIDKKIAIHNKNINPNRSRVMDGTILTSDNSGKIILLGNFWNESSDPWYTRPHNDSDWDCAFSVSTDDGITWSSPTSIRNLLPSGYTAFIGGVGCGITMQDGTLVFPIQIADGVKINSGLIYSTNDGESWNISRTFVPEWSSECNIVELSNGKLLINARSDKSNTRVLYTTDDLGSSWTKFNSILPQPSPCMGSTIKLKNNYGEEIILSTLPNISYREDITLRQLIDNEWHDIDVILKGASDGYSCMAYSENKNELYCVFEKDGSIIFRNITQSLDKIKSSLNSYSANNELYYNRHISINGNDANDGYGRGTEKTSYLGCVSSIPQKKYTTLEITLQSNYDELDLSGYEWIKNFRINLNNKKINKLTIKNFDGYVRIFNGKIGSFNANKNHNIELHTISFEFTDEYIENHYSKITMINCSFQNISSAKQKPMIKNSGGGEIFIENLAVLQSSQNMDSCLYNSNGSIIIEKIIIDNVSKFGSFINTLSRGFIYIYDFKVELSLQNNWIHNDSFNYMKPTIQSTDMKLFRLNGVIKNGVNSTNTVLTTIPISPKNDLLCSCTGWKDGSTVINVMLLIKTDGTVTISSGNQSGITHISLDGITFYA